MVGQGTAWSRFLSVVAVACISAPHAAGASDASPVSVGMGVHGTVHLGEGISHSDGVGGGAQIRLRFVDVLSLRLDYDFGRTGKLDVAQATKLSHLVPYPDLKASMGFHFYPNQYCSPYFALGAGINTGVGFGAPMLLGGFGLETTMWDHWVIGLAGHVYYATPDRIADFVSREVARGNTDYSAGDFLTPGAFQIGFELSYYL